MKGFCRDCQNLLKTEIENEELVLYCFCCRNKYPALPEDTLCDEQVKEGNVAIYERILNKAGKDPVNLKAFVNCRRCTNTVVRQVRIGEDMKLFNVCTKCHHKWLYDAVE